MRDAINYLVSTASFVPHGYCLLWRPDLVWVHAVSDLLIALAYFSIPLALAHFVRRRATWVSPQAVMNAANIQKIHLNRRSRQA